MKSRFLAEHFTVNISKFQLPRRGVKSQLSRFFGMYMNMVGLTQRISEIPLSQTEMNTSPFRPLVFLTMTSLLLLWLLLKLEHIPTLYNNRRETCTVKNIWVNYHGLPKKSWHLLIT